MAARGKVEEKSQKFLAAQRDLFDSCGDIISKVNMDDREVVCQICKRQMSKYYCPRCNIPYCSLSCFQSPSHNQCSEAFYKNEIRNDIQSQSKSTEERRKMLELLKRFEEDNGDDGTLDSDDDEEEGISKLAKKLKGIDIDKADPQTIWSLLTPEEQNKFLSTIGNTSSELVQTILGSETISSGRCEPWWEDRPLSGKSSGYERIGKEPEMMDIPNGMLNRRPKGPSLLYNLCGIFTAYAYVTRHFGMSPVGSISEADERSEAVRQVSNLVPFLPDRKSTTVHNSLSSATKDLWSRMDLQSVSSKALGVLLRDASVLLQPVRVTAIPENAHGTNDATVQARRRAILALSDLFNLFGDRRPHTQHKLLFYASHIILTPDKELHAVSSELLDSSYSIVSDSTEEENDKLHQFTTPVPGERARPHSSMSRQKAFIEEITTN